MNDPSPLMMNRSYGMWPPPASVVDDTANPYPNPNRPPFPAAAASSAAPNYARAHWKPTNMGKKPPPGPDSASGVVVSSYVPPLDHSDPALLHHQARCGGRAPRRYYKKKHNNSHRHPGAARAPRNTTSFLIRAKRAGGIASLVSPCPVTPAVLPTPEFSPSREALVDSAKEEWGVDGYGSMNGLIRLRSPRTTPVTMLAPVTAAAAEEEATAEDGSSESDVEEHVVVERRLDHDLSRFEMVYCPVFTDTGDHREGSWSSHVQSSCLLGSHVDNQNAHISRLQEENLTLRDRLFLMERDLADMRRRLVMLETECRRGDARDGNSHNNNNNDVTSAVEEMSDTEEAGDICSEKSVGD